MAQTYRSRALQAERDSYRRLKGEITGLAGAIAPIVLRYASETNDSGRRVIPNRQGTRAQVKAAIWEGVLKPYFIGPGAQPLIGPEPQSPYLRTIVAGIQAQIAVTVAQQTAVLKQYAAKDVYDFLTGPRPLGLQEMRVLREQGPGTTRTPWYDPFHLFVDPAGYRLSDNGWETSQQTRAAIDALLDQHIPLGTAAVDIADLLEPYLWPEAAAVRTLTPYGRDGSYWARRLARTEITASAGRSLVNAALANPYIVGLKWNLSASHPCCDICDELAAGGENGDGVYPKDELPQYPAHPHELCYITQEVSESPADVSARMRAAIQAQQPEAMTLQGAFNPDWLPWALLVGAFVATVFERDTIDFRRLLSLAA